MRQITDHGDTPSTMKGNDIQCTEAFNVTRATPLQDALGHPLKEESDPIHSGLEVGDVAYQLTDREPLAREASALEVQDQGGPHTGCFHIL